MGNTTNYNFKKTKLGHPVRDDDIGDNLALIDTEIHNRETDITTNTGNITTNTGNITTNTADIAAIIEGVTVWAGTSNFAGADGATITHNNNLSNYTASIIQTDADPVGSVGEIWVTDIAVNSFVVRNSGSAITSFTWVILNKKEEPV